MKDPTSPSLVRIRRVEYFLNQEPKFKTSTETEPYVKGKETIQFPKYAWAVARALHVAELDACKMEKKEIFAWAEHILLGGPAPQVVKAASSVVAQVDASSVVAAVDDTPAATINNLPVRVAIYTLLVSARELTRLDRRPGGEELGKLIDTAASAYLMALNSKAAVAQPAAEQITQPPVSAPAAAEAPRVPDPAA